MENILKKTFYLLIIIFSLNSCQALKDGLEGNKKSKSAEEFLIKKKNPLVLPPDYSELPLPKNLSKEDVSEQDYDLKKILDKEYKPSDNNVEKVTNSSLEKTIIEKIKNN